MDVATARAVLDDAAQSRGRLKRQGAAVDADPQLRALVVQVARAKGVDLPAECQDWPGKKLLRACLARSEQAQVRRNPIARDEPFACAHCSADVTPHGRTARDHCPYCLRSVHVDVVPGDRAAGCDGILDPRRLELRQGHPVLFYTCRRCGAERTNRALLDGHPPDDARLIARLSAGEAV